MPPSSAFSSRRQILRRPKICKPPPPPPPTPADWPPDAFPLQWIANWPYEEGSCDFNVFLDFETIVPGERWETFHQQGDNEWSGDFQLDYEAQTANLTLDFVGFCDSTGCQRYALPIVWGVSTLYAVTVWDDYYPEDSIHEAHFTF